MGAVILKKPSLNPVINKDSEGARNPDQLEIVADSEDTVIEHHMVIRAEAQDVRRDIRTD